MTIFADTWYVAKREMIKFFRARMRLLVSLIQPVIWLGLMGNIMQGLTSNPMVAETFGTSNYLAFMTPGIIIMTTLMGGSLAGHRSCGTEGSGTWKNCWPRRSIAGRSRSERRSP